MINYSLSFIEDLREELITKKIICLGTPFDINDRLKAYNIPYQQIECCCDVFNNFNYSSSYYPFKVFELSYLDTVEISKYILLIVDSNVDIVKKHLRSLNIQSQNAIINCYKLPINSRYYNDPDKAVYFRYTTPLAIWKEYCMKKGIVNDQIEHPAHCIPRVILVLTTKCNLRCRDCIALTPYYKKSYHVPLTTLIRSIDSFLFNVDYCYCLELLGGEPFLYPYIDDIIAYLDHCSKIGSIQITTNGIIKAKESTLHLLKSKKIQIRISDYNIEGRNSYSFQKQLQNNGIKFWVQSDIMWMPIGQINKRNATHQTLMDEYSLCFEGQNCKTILNGKLYTCTFASRIADLRLSNNIEFIDLLNESVSWDQLFKFWTRTYSEACDYCQIMNPNAKAIQSAIQE